MKKILEICGLFIVIILLVIFIPSLNTDYIKNGKLYISEIVSQNNTIIKDDYNQYSDYIEIYNGYNHDINLENYYLSDSEFETDKWKFPNIKIKAKEHLIIYASNKNSCNLETRICHTNFNLSSKGETLSLFDKNGNVISKITFPKIGIDNSFSYIRNKYVITESPTPNKKNKHKKIIETNEDYSSLKINEYMTHNTNAHYDLYGNYYDWVEIYNDSNKLINLNNIYISDNKNKLTKFEIPNTSIKAHDYLIIYFSNNSKEYDNGIYANFGLSDNDKNIIISTDEEIIDTVDIVKLEDNISYGKTENGWKYFTSPTPGSINNTASFNKIGGKNGNS